MEKSLLAFEGSSRPSALARGALYALIIGVLGWQLGRVLGSPSHDLAASLIFMGVCVFITLKHPLRGLLLALVLHPFITYIYLNADLGAGIPDITLGRATVAITFILVLARGATGRRPFLPLTWTDVFMVLAAIGLGIAAVRGTSITADLQWLLDMYLMPYMIYYVTKSLTTNRSRLQRVLWVLALMGAYCGVYGIYTVTTGNILFVGQDGISGPLQHSGGLRIMRGLLGSPHVFGLVFAMAIPIDFYLLIKARSPGKRLLCALMLAVTVGGLFFTYKRTAWIATTASFLVMQFFFPRFRRLFLVLLIVFVGVMGLYWDQISESTVVTERMGEGADTLNGRLELWEAAIEDWREEPLFGYGFGGFVTRSAYWAIESQYIWLLVDAGLVGFVPFALVFVFILISSIRIYRARTPVVFAEPDLMAVFWGVFVAYLTCLSTVVMNHELPYALFFLLAGAAVGSQETVLDRPLDRQSKAAKAKP
jgi:O-antigen ligase